MIPVFACIVDEKGVKKGKMATVADCFSITTGSYVHTGKYRLEQK